MNILLTNSLNVSNILAETRAKETTVISDFTNLKEQYEQLGYNFLTQRDVLNSESCDEIDESAQKPTDNWYYCRGEDFTIYENISLGKIFEWRFFIINYYPVSKLPFC